MSNNYEEIEKLLKKEIQILREILGIVSYYTENQDPKLKEQKQALSTTLLPISKKNKKILQSLDQKTLNIIAPFIRQRKMLRDSISKKLLEKRSTQYPSPSLMVKTKPFLRKTLIADQEEVL